jgi:hypothetical protein
MFVDHSPDRPVRHLKWRLRLLSLGGVSAVAGLYLASRAVIWVAIAFLFAGFLLRFLPGPDERYAQDPEERSD